ncbi:MULTISPECIES: type I-F CRISPR-associated protein Csy2 [unclassified Pseudomonas]|uniref:type I-F CRISPR-associated protein Csy2 n=1 Tax=unclassified Pseudomonas TaxID=196821 RepID=UPI0021C821A9|nr:MULTISPECIES: type I-F CRISPR-associated protein Csy2 [unclassified Pseudomonas]MCU1730787.1 type I-F CRISPR-associated protein Csy2 [Pseudomonas sp. 20P_3.2_Bac4]MCU1743354.1 type I-F CRISPR-associated protein Csy2 [Pseudomonas sp. 20P_3.2_Bac5]
MDDFPGFDHLLIVPRLRVQNANAISSPLTHGFPAITAFLGLMWALERKAREADIDLQFNAVAVVAHDYQEQVTDSTFVKAFRLTRNPNNKDGKPAAIVEEGRIHLDISLIFAVQGPALSADPDHNAGLARQVHDLLLQMRIAGGSVITPIANGARHMPYLLALTGNDEDRQALFASSMWRLLPGFVLVERTDLLQQRHTELLALDPEASRLDAWLSLSRINWRAPQSDEDAKPIEKQPWLNDRQDLGWIAPIPIGYGALSELQAPGSVTNARDGSTPFRLVESLYSIGQWISPHRLRAVEDLLWYAESDTERGLYRCRNRYQPETDYSFD